jgi:dihydroflavonol-4-reductase
MTARLNLVTGGAGFIGRHLVRHLLERDERVRVLDLACDPPLPPEAEMVIGSVADPAAVRKAMAGAGRVYHLAANPNLWACDKDEFDRTNRRGTEVVLEAARREGVERVVHCSTESILKDGGGAPIDERAAPRLDDMPGPYCRSKYLAERAALAAAADGLPVVVVNPTLPVGPGDHLLTPPTRMLLLFLNGRSLFYLDCAFNMVDVRDVALGHILAAERGQSGERYILGGTNLRAAELLRQLEELTGLAMPRRVIPYPLALAVGAISETLADHVTGRPPVAPLAGVRLAANPMTFDNSKAVRELGFSCRPLAESLADEVTWLAGRGLLARPCSRLSPAPAD